RCEEDRVRLAGERRAQEPVIQLRDEPPELSADQLRPRRDRAERLHPAPALEPRQRPDRHLLQAERVRMVLRRELHHLLEEGAALWRDGVSVEHVPGADEEGQRRTSLGAWLGGVSRTRSRASSTSASGTTRS